MALLAAFHPRDKELTGAEIARRAGLPRSTVYRLVGELTTHGILDQTHEGLFRLGTRLVELGHLATSQRGFRELASPYLADLAAVTRTTVHLSVLDNHEIKIIETYRPPSHPSTPARMDSRFPATATAAGKVILAFSPPDVVDAVLARGFPRLTPNSITNETQFLAELAKVRRAGVAFDQEEHLMGTVSCAVPLIGEGHRVYGAISISGSTTSRFDHMVSALQTTAVTLSRLQASFI